MADDVPLKDRWQVVRANADGTERRIPPLGLPHKFLADGCAASFARLSPQNTYRVEPWEPTEAQAQTIQAMKDELGEALEAMTGPDDDEGWERLRQTRFGRACRDVFAKKRAETEGCAEVPPRRVRTTEGADE